MSDKCDNDGGCGCGTLILLIVFLMFLNGCFKGCGY